jgi:hypothetical protein
MKITVNHKMRINVNHNSGHIVGGGKVIQEINFNLLKAGIAHLYLHLKNTN